MEIALGDRLLGHLDCIQDFTLVEVMPLWIVNLPRDLEDGDTYKVGL